MCSAKVGLPLSVALLLSSALAYAVQPVEARRPPDREDVDAVMAGAAERLAEGGPLAFAEALSGFDPTGIFRRTVEPFQARWESERTEGFDRVELIRKESAGPSTVRFQLLLLLKEKPVIWTTTLVWVSQGGWYLRTFSASDQLHERRDLFRAATAPGEFTEPSFIAASFAETLATNDEAALQRLATHFSEEMVADGPERPAQRWAESMAGMRRLIGWRHERCELAAFEALTRSLVRVVYVEYAPNNQAVWELYLYHPAERWIVTAVNFQAGNDHTIEMLFPRASSNPIPGSASAAAPLRN